VDGDARDVAMGFGSHSRGEAIVGDAMHILPLALHEMRAAYHEFVGSAQCAAVLAQPILATGRDCTQVSSIEQGCSLQVT